MTINSDINVLGSLPDFNLINLFLNESIQSINQQGGYQSFTAIKTDKSVRRFEKAITGTLIGFKNKESESLIRSLLGAESMSEDSLMMIFWNASYNNELLNYLNEMVYFIAFYSGRTTIRQDEVAACIRELRHTEKDIQKWADSTIEVTASKYLTMLKKFNLMEGSVNKKILYPYLTDKMLMLFVYWLLAIETKPNILESHWLKYSFSEIPIFIERILQKKFAKFINLSYTGDRLKIETIVPYENIYDAISQS